MFRYLSFTLLSLLLFTLSCSSSERSTLSYVPAASYAVVALNWRTVRSDADLLKIIKGEQLTSMLQHLHLDETKVSEIVVFGNMENSADGLAGLIVKGSFDSKDLVKSLKSEGWTEQSVGRQQIYLHPTDRSCLTTFGPNLIAAGTVSGVKASIEARANVELRFTSSPSYKKLSSRFQGNKYPVLIMVAIPQVTQDMANTALELSSKVMDYAGVGPLGELVNKIGFAQGFGCAISHEREMFPTNIMAIMKDQESAKLVSGGINLLKALNSMVPQDTSNARNADASRAFQNMSVDRSGEVLEIKLTMSRRDVFGGAEFP